MRAERRTVDESVTALAIGRLMLRDFRNYRTAEVTADGRPVVLWGPNGAGKTNLLEAISLFAPGRGLRGARLVDMDRRDGGPFRLEAWLVSRDGPREAATWHEPATDRRFVSLDGGPPRSPAELDELPGILWLTPSMDRLFGDAPAARRRFLDRLVLAHYPGHGRAAAAFERSLRERAQLLREPEADPLWLDALETRMAEQAVAVAAARLAFVRDLAAELRAAPTGFPALEPLLTGEVEQRLTATSALAVEEWLATTLRRARARDAELGGASAGPHRSDFGLRFLGSGEPVAATSTGQQKLALLAVLIAAVRLRQRLRGEAPLVLLDEVAAHLDAYRRAALFDLLVATGAQVWLSGTDSELFRPLVGRARIYRVCEAKLDADD